MVKSCNSSFDLEPASIVYEFIVMLEEPWLIIPQYPPSMLNSDMDIIENLLVEMTVLCFLIRLEFMMNLTLD